MNCNVCQDEKSERILYSDLVNIIKLELSEKAIYNTIMILTKDLLFKSKSKNHNITKLAFTEVFI